MAQIPRVPTLWEVDGTGTGTALHFCSDVCRDGWRREQAMANTPGEYESGYDTHDQVRTGAVCTACATPLAPRGH